MAVRRSAPKRFAIYLRCSTDDQKLGDYTTIHTQREINRCHVESLGGQIIGEYADEGKSGTSLNRPEWKRLLSDAQAGKFDAVCITYMSRLGRGNPYVIAEYELQKCRVDVVMVKEKFTDDIAGFVTKSMTTMMDAMYPKMVSQWTKTKMEQMVERGYRTGGTVPFGYMSIPIENAVAPDFSREKEPPRRLVPDPETSEIVLRAFELFSKKGTVAAVRRYLNSVCERRWTTTSVSNILKNEVYLGIQAFGKWRNESAHPPIVPRGLWDDAQKLLELTRQRVMRGPVSIERSFAYMLRGKVFCPHCGCIYTDSVATGRNGRVEYYECQSHSKKRTKCPVQRVNASYLHAAVLKEIRRAAEHRTVMHRLIAESGGWGGPTDAQKALRGQLGKRKQFLEMQAGNLTRAIGEGRALSTLLPAIEKVEWEIADVVAQLDAIKEEIAAATIERPTAESVQELWSGLLELWDHVTPGERQELISGIVERVEILEKQKASMRLLTTIAGGQARGFAPTSNLGAEMDAFSINSRFNPSFCDVPAIFPSGGLLRKKRQRMPKEPFPATPTPS